MKFKNTKIITISEEKIINDFIKIQNNFSIQEIKNGLPKQKRNKFQKLNLFELYHTIFEILTFNLLNKHGARAIIRGSGQKGLSNTYLKNNKNIIFKFLNYKQSLKDFIEKNDTLKKSIKRKIIQEINLWKKSGLLKNYENIIDVSYFEKSTINKKTFNIFKSIIDFFRQKKCCLFISGSSSYSDKTNPNDIDICIVADEIMIPPFFKNISPRIKKLFKIGKIPTASIKIKNRKDILDISIRFINSKFIFNYYRRKVKRLKYWREYSLLKDKIYNHLITDIEANRYNLKTEETKINDGFLIHNLFLTRNKGIPIITLDVHMILTGKIIIDNICGLTIKKQILENISKIKRIDTKKFIKSLEMRTSCPIKDEIKEEIISLIKIIQK